MKRKILIVAGDATLRAAIARVLQPAGYAVEIAGEAERTRELLGLGDIDAAIVAPSSLGAGGLSLTHELQGKIESVIVMADNANEVGRLAQSLPGAVVLLQPWIGHGCWIA